jgi:hypothetical protein
MRRRSYTAARLTRIPVTVPTAAQPVSQLGQTVVTLATAIGNHEIEPCPVCGHFACDCDEWHELMHTDPIAIQLSH